MQPWWVQIVEWAVTTFPERKSARETDCPCKFLATTIFETPSVSSDMCHTKYPLTFDGELAGVGAAPVAGDDGCTAIGGLLGTRACHCNFPLLLTHM